MNEAEKQIFDDVKDNGKNIAIIEERQKNQHKENATDISEIKGDIKKFINHGGQIKAQWVLLILVLGWLVKLSLQ